MFTLTAGQLLMLAVAFGFATLITATISLLSAFDRRWGRMALTLSFALLFGVVSVKSALAANTKLSSLSAGSAMADADLFYDVQSAGSGGVKETGAQIWTWIQTHLPSPGPIGGTTPAAGSFTTLSGTGTLTTNVTGGGTVCLQASNTGVVSGTGSACGSGGGATLHPGYIAANWYVPVFWNNESASAAPVIGTTYCTLGYIAQQLTISQLGLRVSTGSAGNAQMALYNNDAVVLNRPSTQIDHTSSVSTASVANVNSAFVGGNHQVNAGFYWFCFQADNVGVRYGSLVGNSNGWVSAMLGSTSLTVEVGSTSNLTGVSIAGTFGTWPANLNGSTFVEIQNNTAPYMPFLVNSVP